MTRSDFADLIKEGPLLLDGATGTNLYLAGMPKGVCTEQWILEHPDVLTNLQKAYARAGSQVLYAPTFGANRHALGKFGLDNQLEEMNRRLVALSREAGGPDTLIAGDVSPTGLLLESCGGEASIDEVFDIYQQQIGVLCEEGVDLIVIETMMSVDETVIALDAARSVCDLPVMCTLSVHMDGRCYFGGSIWEAVETLDGMGVDAAGVNCCSGPEQLVHMIREIRKMTEVPVIAKPNAGMPQIDEQGNAVYNMGPVEYSAHMRRLVDNGASIIGGCCGTTPEYIKKLRQMLQNPAILI